MEILILIRKNMHKRVEKDRPLNEKHKDDISRKKKKMGSNRRDTGNWVKWKKDECGKKRTGNRQSSLIHRVDD